MKPDWKDAPEGANYLAMDFSGYWYCYNECPIWNNDKCRWVYGGKSWVAAKPKFDACDTLEARP